MKTFKKIFILLFAAILAVNLVACDLGSLIGGDDDPTDSASELETNQAQTEQKLTELATKKGYEITCKLSSSDNPQDSTYTTVGANGNITWYYEGQNKAEGLAYIYDKEQNMVLFYQCKEGTWEYGYAYIVEESGEYDFDLTALFSSFMQAYTVEGAFKKAGTEKVAGRKCNVYSYSMLSDLGIVGKLVGVDIKWKYYIDQETGICMKMYLEGSEGADTSSVTFEVTEFKEEAKAPDLPEAKDVYPINPKNPKETGEWNLFKYFGFTNVCPSKDDLLVEDSYEELYAGYMTYYFKVDSIKGDEDARHTQSENYMKALYTKVLEEIKKNSDDKKAYVYGDSGFEEAPRSLEEGITFTLCLYHNGKVYEINAYLNDELESELAAYKLELNARLVD